MLSSARIAWLSTIILTPVLLFLYRVSLINLFKKYYKSFIVGFLLVSIFIVSLIYINQQQIFNKINEIRQEIVIFQEGTIIKKYEHLIDTGQTEEALKLQRFKRLLSFKTGINLSTYKPWFGFGTGGIKTAVDIGITRGEAHMFIREDAFIDDYFETIVSFGFVGFILKYSLVLYFLFWFFKNRKYNIHLSNAGIILIITHLIFGITDITLTRSAHISIYYIFLAVFYNDLLHRKNKYLNKLPNS